MTDSVLHLVVGRAAAAVQHQRPVTDRGDLIQPVNAQFRRLLIYAVGGADGYRKSIHIGDLHKFCHFFRNGQALSGIGVCASLTDAAYTAIAHMTKLRFHRNTPGMGILCHLRRVARIAVKRQDGTVVHNGAEACINGLLNQAKIRRMIQVKTYRNVKETGCLPHHRGDHGHAFPLQVHAQSHQQRRRPFLLACLQNRPQHFVIADIKRRNCIMILSCIRQHFFHGNQHVPFLLRFDAFIISRN